ncbi:shikimate kinase [bacterium BMS3Abin04]|nr:shikimate kinase [bacterium BMS3Abin04]
MGTERFYITGFMTSGKSTIGPILANVLGWSFFDLDKVIENEFGKTIVEIFTDKGEQEFRNLEKQYISQIASNENVIIALGGGTIANEQNLALIKSTGKLIYLRASPDIIYKRIKNKIDRPLFRDMVLSESNPEDFLVRIKSLLDKREKFYEQADIIIDTGEHPIGRTVDKIAKIVFRFIHE